MEERAADDAMKLFVDSDNAMGSSRGDVDDAYAIAALILSAVPIAAISSCAGNTSEPLAFENNRRLAALLRSDVPLLHASAAREELREFDGRIVALGPLTNVADAAAAAEVIIVGGSWTSSGRWPPFWPYEFNLTRDRGAAKRIFESQLPLTIFPIDVARRLTISEKDLEAIPGALGDYLRVNTRRWFMHLRRARLTRRFPIYDLAAALYAIEDIGFTWRETTATMNGFTAIRFDRGTRPVKVCIGLDRDALWSRLLRLLA